jgi:hypothetical protein
MPQKQAYKEYYTAGEVKKKLGITDGQLYNYVRYGHLQRIMPPGKKQGVYKRDEVDKFALELSAFLSGSEKAKRLTFTNVTETDVPEFVRLTEEIFSGVHLDVAERVKWVKKNPEVLYQLCLDTQIIGCAVILPLKSEKIEQILRDEASADEIKAEEIEVYGTGKPFYLYITGVGVSPALNKQDKRWYGAKLARNIGETIINLGKRGIEIKTITARSETVDGIRLLRHVGFRQIPSITRKVNFRINMKEANHIDIAVQYNKELMETKKQKAQRRRKTAEEQADGMPLAKPSAK